MFTHLDERGWLGLETPEVRVGYLLNRAWFELYEKRSEVYAARVSYMVVGGS